MLEHRLKGCLFAFSGLFLTLNALLYLFWVKLEAKFSFFQLNEGSYPLLYILAMPIAFAASERHMQRVFSQLNNPSLWTSLIFSLRFSGILGSVFAFIYLLLKDVDTSRLFIISYIPLAFMFNWLLVRFVPPALADWFFQKSNSLEAVLIGFGQVPEDLRKYIGKLNSMGIHCKRYYSDRPVDLPDMTWMGEASQLRVEGDDKKTLDADIVFSFTDDIHRAEFQAIIDRCVRAGTRVQIYSNVANAFPDPVRIVDDGPMHFITFYDEPLQNPINIYFKRFLDICISIPFILFALPLLTLVVWLVQRSQSPGPIIFKQVRYGINRKPFMIYKFRSMHVQDRSNEGQQARQGDPRIFPFGSFLRRSSLDEFPQFLNVFMGQMSIVGPRPHLTVHDDFFERYYRRYRSRHFVKPGITGLAQIRGFRGEAREEHDIVGRVENDLTYITQWSLSMEIYIIFKTGWQVLFPPKTAY